MELTIKFPPRLAPLVVEEVTKNTPDTIEVLMLSSWTCLVPEAEQDYAHVNNNQHFKLDLGQRTLAIKGQRHALQHEGGWIMWLIANLLKSGAEIVHYQTSDPRLAWDETLDDYLHNRGTWEEWVAHRPDPYNIPPRFREERAAIEDMRTMSAAKLNALHDHKVLARARAVYAKR